MKIVFAGTPGFAVAALEKLHDEGHDIRLVVSQPDRPSGRGLKVIPTDVKRKAVELGLKLFQPENINSENSLKEIAACEPEVMVVAAFGQILKKSLLEIPTLGCLNIHASLLPLLRGAAPIQRAIMEGHSKTGVTTMQMNRRMDAGEILLTSTVPIGKETTAGEMHDILAEKGAQLIVETLKGLEDGTITALPQDHESATYSPKISPEERLIDWTKQAGEIDGKIRGLSPHPGAYTSFRGKRILILKSLSETGLTGTHDADDAPPGTIVGKGPKHLEVQTGGGRVTLLSLRPEGKKEMTAGNWALGARITENDIFGEN